MTRDYTKIKAWQLADKLALIVYEITTNFPKSEIWGLTSHSSLSEIGYLCKFAYKIGYIDSETYNRFELKYNEVAKT
jgi:hypothetical protein